MTLELAQTLHGYTRGHRLLAQGGDIAESELHELDRLTDLSGYLPTDASVDAYHTGFPCGRYYAFACTWPDHTAPRRGTVLTHTLLIPRERWIEHADPFAWSQLHRKPATALDSEAYATVPSGEPGPLAPPELAPEQLRGLLHLWFGQPDRPLLWIDEPSLPLARALWPWLWHEDRRNFAFCTFSLQVRTMRSGRPFDLLVLPHAALGAFHEQTGSRAWWREGRVWRGEIEPWLDAVLEAGPQALAEFIGDLRRRGLGPPPPGMLRGARRCIELHAGAAERLAAARAHLDLLGRVWPQLPGEHPAVQDAVALLLARQGEAPLTPRPLWDLHHLVTHPAAIAQFDGATPLGQAILDGLREHLLVRLESSDELAGAGLVELFSSGHPRVRDVVYEVVAAAMDPTRPLAWSEPLLDHAENSHDAGLEQLLWRGLPHERLVEWLRMRLASSELDERERLRARVVELAAERGSPELARAGWADDVAAGLQAAASVVVAQPACAARFEVVLRRESETEQLAWCFECEVEPLRPLAIRIGAALVRKDVLAPNRLATRCQGHRLGPAIFNEARPWMAERELEEVLRAHGQLAHQLVLLLFEGSINAYSLAGPAGRAAPSSLLWTPASRLALAKGKPSKEILDEVVPRLLGETMAGMLSADEAGAWLSEPHVSGWLKQASTWELDRPLHTRPPGALTSLVLASGHALRSSPMREPGLPLARVLEKATREELAESVEALVELLTMLPPTNASGLQLRAELLGALDRHRIPQGWRVVELAFYPVYRGIMGGLELERVSWWRSYSWDRGKHWRHWLLDVWVACNWPPESLVRCLEGDAELAWRVFTRASKLSSQSRHLLLSLGPALGGDSRLRLIWAESLR